ncbi:carbohydrate kinase family protein [Actibacterium ureilyticum]|uniref:carbohydrate kinase family protein n=1 Tax=Actibacterium ureilyticum TaxID=1590614 RepID=UPI000BAAC89A|nr:carbohydrate kinase [Actibacterium ureilyticum]
MILCCGEALIDMIPSATVSGPDGFVPHNGGAVYNTAIALGRLGVPTGMLTGMSTDLFGQQLADGLRDSGVDMAHLIRSDRPTTLAFVRLTDGHAEYEFYDENTAGRMITPDDLPTLSGDVGALYFGGISLACEPCADTYAALCASAGDARAVMVDPNIRPGFIRDADRFSARMTAILRRADIVKVSDEDLDWLFPDQGGFQDQVRALQALGAALVIVTRGGAGAVACLSGGETITVPAQKADVIDTVGAGDTFNAGVLASLSKDGVLTRTALAGLDPDIARKALEHGARVAAVTVSRAGANPPWAHELTG